MSNNLTLHPLNSVYIDSDNLVNKDSGNNTFLVKFGTGFRTSTTTRVSISNFRLKYSWFNISAARGNNKFDYVWFDEASDAGTWHSAGVNTGRAFPVTIPDGFYDIPTLNAFLQFEMVKNGHYLVETLTGRYVYYLEFLLNTQYQRAQINSYQLPNTLPFGFTAGSGVNFAPGPNTPPWTCPKLVLYKGGTDSLAEYFGFNEVATYGVNNMSPWNVVAYASTVVAPRVIIPTTATPADPAIPSISTLGDVAPVVSTVSSVLLTCPLVDNPLRSSAMNHSSSVVTTQTVNVNFGVNIDNTVLYNVWTPLYKNTLINEMKFQLTDQNGTLLEIQDSKNISIELLITDLLYQ